MKTTLVLLTFFVVVLLSSLICQSLVACPSAASLAEDEKLITTGNPDSATPDNSGDHGKKKAKRKRSRRKCVYCPIMRTFEKGQWEANFSAGLVPTFLMDRATIIVPPLSLGAEYRLSEKFSIGASFSHSASESQPRLIGDGINATWTNTHFIVGLRPNIHITQIENWDFYGGFSVGVNYSIVNGNSNVKGFELEKMERHLGIKGQRISPSFYGFTGARYVVSPKCTLNAEIGFGISIFSVGANYLL